LGRFCRLVSERFGVTLSMMSFRMLKSYNKINFVIQLANQALGLLVKNLKLAQ